MMAGLAELTTELRRRVLAVPATPEGGLDASKASSEELIAYGLGPRPEREASPATQRFWNAMYGGKVKSRGWDFSALAHSPLYRILGTAVTRRSRWQTSRNWSGAVVTSRSRPLSTITNPQLFSEVSGRWTVPRVSAPAGHAANAVYMCSTWIGLDGFRFSPGSLPQVGTTQIVEVVNGVPKAQRCEAWWQWWMRDHRFEPQIFTALSVNPDDQIAARVVLTDPFRVQINIRNLTQDSEVNLVDVRAPDHPVFGGGTGPGIPPIFVPIPARGQTAEWITERPTELKGDALYPLPVFTPVTFEACLATEPGGFARMLEAARYLRMVSTQGSPPEGARVIAKPYRVAGEPRITIEYAA